MQNIVKITKKGEGFVKNKILTVVTLLSAIYFVLGATTAFSHYLSRGYSLYYMTYDVQVDGSAYAFDTAAQNWTDAVATTISKSTYSNNDAHYSNNYGYTWYGLYSPTLYDGKAAFFDIYLNGRTLKRDYPENYINPMVSTATHEFGHAQFLLDLKQGYGNSSIMSYERNRTTILTPQSHDINDINAYR